MDIKVREVAGQGSVDDRLFILNLIVLQHLGDFLLVNVGAWEEEFFVFMFLDQLYQVSGAFLAVEDLPFPELHIFLQVVRRRFRYAEIFHRFRHFEPHLLADPEVMVYRITRSENDRSEFLDAYPVLPEIPGRNAFDPEELLESNIDIEFAGYFAVRRFFKIERLRLGNKNILDFQGRTVLAFKLKTA